MKDHYYEWPPLALIFAAHLVWNRRRHRRASAAIVAADQAEYDAVWERLAADQSTAAAIGRLGITAGELVHPVYCARPPPLPRLPRRGGSGASWPACSPGRAAAARADQRRPRRPRRPP